MTQPSSTRRVGTGASSRSELNADVAGFAANPLFLVLGALLALAVAAIHISDQKGLFKLKDPTYIGVLYWILEAAAIAVAVWLVTRRIVRTAWFLALGVGVAPLIAFVISRTVGLPSYMDDKGNWTEPIAIASYLAEGLLILVAVVALGRAGRTATQRA